MNKRNYNLAILAPSRNAYSETFIKQHLDKLQGNKFFYYGNMEEKSLEGKGLLRNQKRTKFLKIKRKFLGNSSTWFFDKVFEDSLKRNGIDVILVEFGFLAHKNIEPIKKLNIPLIVHFHGLDASVDQIIKNCNYYKEVFEYSSFVIAVSKKMYNDFLDLGCPEDKLVYNVYGPAENFHKVNPSFEKKNLIAIGRFVDKKAPYYLIMAFKKVLKQHPGARLVMAGRGDLLNTCKNLVKYYKLEDKIDFPGVISPDQYRKYLSNSMIMIQHSITAENGDSEGTPVSILEASAAGLPVVSTLHGGIPDVIINNETGYLVKEHDVDEMALQIIKLLDSPSLARNMGEKGKKNILENYSLEKHISNLNEVIQKSLERSKFWE